MITRTLVMLLGELTGLALLGLYGLYRQSRGKSGFTPEVQAITCISIFCLNVSLFFVLMMWLHEGAPPL